MHGWLWTIPLVSTLAGWLIALLIRSLLVRRLPALFSAAAGDMAALLLASPVVRSKISDPETARQIMPLIESHLDHFLRHKLGKAMPMIDMFIGDKTISQLKAIFMKELQEIFPVVMNSYIDSLSISIPRQLSVEAATGHVRQFLQGALDKRRYALPLAGLLAGLVIGILQVAVILFIM